MVVLCEITFKVLSMWINNFFVSALAYDSGEWNLDGNLGTFIKKKNIENTLTAMIARRNF